MKPEEKHTSPEDTDQQIHGNPKTQFEYHGYYLNIWIGALVRYLFAFRRHSFAELYSEKDSRFNFYIGTLAMVVALFVIIGAAFLIKG